MKLPELSQPHYEVKLLSYSKPITFRPFTVREEMIMRMAVEAKDLNSTTAALKQVINNCLVTEGINVDDMAIVDMETFFFHLRARSIGETGSQFFKCKNEVTVQTEEGEVEKECGFLMEVPVNYLEVPVINKEIERNIKFNDELGVIMKFPTYSIANELIKSLPEEVEVRLVAGCIEKVFTNQEVFNASDCTQQELIDFVLNLPTDKYERMRDFCVNAPKNQLIVKQQCSRCGYEHNLTLEGIQDFFA